MQKFFALILTWILVLSLAGCHASQPGGQGTSSTALNARDISEYLVEEGDNLYLILPISKEEVKVYCSNRNDLEKIDFELLQAAEAKLLDQISKYPEKQEPYFTVHAGDGQVELCVELIVYKTPPTVNPTSTEPTPPQSGCGIDHDHLNFYELISKTGDS